jgi:hypothetical protein
MGDDGGVAGESGQFGAGLVNIVPEDDNHGRQSPGDRLAGRSSQE